ncbi:MAG: preprotein translocase subunit SecY [Oscillospiraceae bacterium]|nr:preprotein translocase subunit SecY [Oscillospiraceae bacterium]
MLQTFKNAWKIDDLRKKIIFTLVVLVLYRLGCAIAVPFIQPSAINSMIAADSGSMLGYLNMISGGAFANATLFALGVVPYINSSIIITLLTVAIPYLENLSKEGEEGRKKIAKITRYVAVVIAFVLAFGYYFVLKNNNALIYTEGLAGTFAAVVIISTFVGGSMLLMWMGEQIDKKGIGNGISLIIFTGIISRLSVTVTTLIAMIQAGIAGETKYLIMAPLILIFAVLVIAFSVVLNNAERRLPVQYAKRVVGRKMMGGQSTYLPIKVNMSGVMPVIFASSIMSIPGTIKEFFNIESEIVNKILGVFDYNGIVYAIGYVLLIIAFNYFYVSMQYNPIEIANNLRKNNGVIPGFRPGKMTQDFIAKVISKITFIGAMFLVVVAVLPIITGNLTGTNIQLGGTSILIIVGVALEVTQQLESQMVMRHHKGFLE